MGSGIALTEAEHAEKLALIEGRSKARYTVREHFSGPVNHPHESIYEQLRANVRRGLPQARTYAPGPYKAMLLCGGPSLNRYVGAIRRRRANGWKLITVNGTHNWALDRGITPSLQIVMDARELNRVFVERPHEDCRYLICSQCHGSVFEALEGYDVQIWHGGAPSEIEREILDGYYLGRWTPVPGGTSVGPRAIALAYMLGVRHLDVYGLDGCIIGGEHHAYEQPQNDFNHAYSVKVGRRRFVMHGWMLKQFDEWLQFAGQVPDDYKLTIKGDGAIAYVTELAATRKRAPKIVADRLEITDGNVERIAAG